MMIPFSELTPRQQYKIITFQNKIKDLVNCDVLYAPKKNEITNSVKESIGRSYNQNYNNKHNSIRTDPRNKQNSQQPCKFVKLCVNFTTLADENTTQTDEVDTQRTTISRRGV